MLALCKVIRSPFANKILGLCYQPHFVTLLNRNTDFGGTGRRGGYQSDLAPHR